MEIDVIETLKATVAIVGPFLGGGGVWAYMTMRAKTGLSSPSQITASQAELVSAVNAQTMTLLEENSRLRKESNRERRQLAQRANRLDKQLSVLTKAVNTATAKHEECEMNLADVRALIESMRTNPPADMLVINPHSLKDQLDAPD